VFVEGLQFLRPPGRAVYMHMMRISALIFEDSRATMCAGLKIIELGAGCGWLGMTIARNLPLATVCMTEMEEGGALEHLEYNLALNPLENVSTAACDWALWQACVSDLFIFMCIHVRVFVSRVRVRACVRTCCPCAAICACIQLLHGAHERIVK
jgi:hypothetical protein